MGVESICSSAFLHKDIQRSVETSGRLKELQSNIAADKSIRLTQSNSESIRLVKKPLQTSIDIPSMISEQSTNILRCLGKVDEIRSMEV